MCGIIGGIHCDLSREQREDARDTLSQRGPDSFGYWSDVDCWFGHRRLAIQDLSSAGHQPMFSQNGEWIVTFNGELYNHPQLREELNAERHIRWVGHSDTETVIESIAHWGISRSLQKFRGMFALGIFHMPSKTLTLARDFFGEKPLYWCRTAKGSTYFASELKALRQLSPLQFDLNQHAFYEYLTFGFVRSPHTIFGGIEKVRPGEFITISKNGAVTREMYLSLQELVSARGLFRGTFPQALEEFDHLFCRSLRGQLISDVPLGAFLSGGIDSSLVAAYLRKQLQIPLKTFTIGFQEASHNEAPFAQSVAETLGTEHQLLKLHSDELLEVIKELPQWWDEPCGDSSQIPTLLISRLTRRHVTVSLSGDGGDELFLGYRRYQRELEASHKLLLGTFARFFRRLPHQHFRSERLRGWGAWAEATSDLERYRYRLQLIPDASRFFLDKVHYLGMTDLCQEIESGLGLSVKMRFFDLQSYLPEDILLKVDRGAMACSLESRAPFLNIDLAVFALSLPSEYLLDQLGGKLLLRASLARYLPQELINRPKKGFSVPLKQWLRRELRPWAEALLHEQLPEVSCLNTKAVWQYWGQFQEGQVHGNGFLWSLLQFLRWRQHWN